MKFVSNTMNSDAKFVYNFVMWFCWERSSCEKGFIRRRRQNHAD